MSSRDKILEQAKLLFAEKGFAGVSMRDLAKAVNMSAASLYHHFPDKNTLYLETMRIAFADKEQAFSEVWQADCAAEEKLLLYINCLTEMLLQDRVFSRLVQREILEADQVRMQMLGENVFKVQFGHLMELVQELTPDGDAHLGAVSVLSLLKYHVEMQPLLQFLPGWKAEHKQAEVIANHVSTILLHGLTEE